MAKLLLHTCCAPCLIYPLKRLSEQGFEVTAYFYNPNIHPYGEYKARREATERYSQDAGVEAIFPDYRPEEYFQAVHLREANPGRCVTCWTLRLAKTAREAKDNGFTHFTSTLLVSPYQDQNALRLIGGDTAKSVGLQFHYEDFRPGFRKAHDEARAAGIYCQKYCGCIFSELERYGKDKSNIGHKVTTSQGHKL